MESYLQLRIVINHDEDLDITSDEFLEMVNNYLSVEYPFLGFNPCGAVLMDEMCET